MLLSSFSGNLTEAGCDEAGRGCFAGPVFAAAVILPADYNNPLLDDSKKLTARQREMLHEVIENDAVSWAVAAVENDVIDKINILNASIMAMHYAVEKLNPSPELLLIDGNRFHSYPGLPHHCIIKGDGIYQSIAAASILAKYYRDLFMIGIDKSFPQYGWKNNKGYLTSVHREAIEKYGLSPFHRKSFKMNKQIDLEFV
jgi:ribonuclease HII